MEYRCVQCGFRIKTLFVQYSPGNIRLMKCVNCKAVADEYIECELMIVLIDLILHKPKAYRHVLFNALNHERTHFQGLLWKSLVGFLVLDAYVDGCISWELYVSVFFPFCNQEPAQDISSIFQVQRSVACNSNFKLLQDSSHCHDGLLSNAIWPTD
ncbi:hypothetical protein CXB51_030514 [Gossypium anomalum]|uniref:Protein ARV n=1 Tax=Gossypium anomalum TaxID=47600 RepID=A0A8J6CJQ4_9ROSI|nr:hypothetical protein CXB51_030514 [Gossypium anomalum]